MISINSLIEIQFPFSILNMLNELRPEIIKNKLSIDQFKQLTCFILLSGIVFFSFSFCFQSGDWKCLKIETEKK